MIHLERFGQDDFQQLINWVDEEAILTAWAGNLFSFPLTMRSLEWYVRDTNMFQSSEAFVYKAVDESGLPVGHISLGSISWKNRAARLTRVLVGDPAARDKGYCHEMVKAVLKVAFEELNLHRVELGVYSNNPSATRCYEKAGFMKEGTRRDILWNNNQWSSMIEMSILEDEWRKLHL